MPEKPSMLMPALYGGIIMAVISAVPGLNLINCLCCAGVMFGGFMAVYFYKKELTPEMPPLQSSDGLQLGALAGVFGGVIGAILTVLITQAMGNIGGEFMLQFMERFRDSMPPESWDEMEQSIKEGGLSILQIITSLVVSIIFGLLGGLIGYAVLKPKQQMMNVQPPQMP